MKTNMAMHQRKMKDTVAEKKKVRNAFYEGTFCDTHLALAFSLQHWRVDFAGNLGANT